MGTTVRWVQPGDPTKPANVRDQNFPTKKAALDEIGRRQVSIIQRLPIPGGRFYCVTLKK